MVGRSVALTAPATGGQSRLTTDNADLTVRGGPGRLIRIRGSLSGSIVQPVFLHRLGPGGLVVSPRCPLHFGNCSLTLAATVPAALPASVTDNFGNLWASALRGAVSLDDSNGTLFATGLTGTIRLSDQFGAVDAAQLAGSLRVSASNSEVTVRDVSGDTQVSDSFGGIVVTGLAAADVVASDSNGNIVLRFTRVPRHVDVSDSFGNVWIDLPPGSATYKIQAGRPPYGSLRVAVPQSATSPHVITARDSNGNITISN
jgi:hypothetical protein